MDYIFNHEKIIKKLMISCNRVVISKYKNRCDTFLNSLRSSNLVKSK